ncbi:MAG: rRNA maturation RNase YbeY [Balneolia bacterium]|nr:rRNA maturation RNase YbeY [Balneolia bacterium]
MKPNAIEIIVENTTELDVSVDEDVVAEVAELMQQNENVRFSLLEVVFVDEGEILDINREHLQHDYVTDIITFHYHEDDEPIEGTLFCCAPRIAEQAVEFESAPETEFTRIIIHGMLHLCGYEDSSTEDKARMTELENEYLKQLDYL